MNPLRTLLIGGTGFIGTALVDPLLASGRLLTLLGRSHPPRNPLPDNVRYIQGDAGNSTLLNSLLPEIDEVIDLAYATTPQTSFIDPLFDVTANLPSTVNVLQIASKFPLRRYIFISSGGTVYGNTSAAIINESHPTQPISPYGISKLVGEKYAHFFHQMFGLPVLIVRPANPYGPLQLGRSTQGFIGAAIAAIRNNRPVTIYGQRGTIRDYLHVIDLAQGIVSLLDQGQTGLTYNLGSGSGHDNADIVCMLENLAEDEGIPMQCIHLPKRSFDVKSNVLDSSLAHKHVHWKPQISLTDGVRQLWTFSRNKTR